MFTTLPCFFNPDISTNMSPGVNIINRKASIVSVNGAGGSGGCSEPLRGNIRGQGPLRKFQAPKSIKIGLK